MQNPAIAQTAHAIFGRGLEVKERLERGDTPDFDAELTTLQRLLFAEGEVASNPEYAGLTDRIDPNAGFFGARYALACWLDEIMIGDNPEGPAAEWSYRWREKTMEFALFGEGTQERAWRFWEQARKAAARPGTDALEVYLWSVMLGFRGNPEDAGIELTEWADRTRQHIIKSRNQRFPHEAGGKPPPDVEVLSGRRQFKRMLQLGTLVVAAVAFSIGYWVLKTQD